MTTRAARSAPRALPAAAPHSRTSFPPRARPRTLLLLLPLLLLGAAQPLVTPAFEQWHRQYDKRVLQPLPGADMADLVGNPREIDFDVHSDPAEEIYAVTFADLHAVYPVSFETLRDTILDLDSHKDFVPRVVSSNAEPTGDDPPSWRQHVRLKFRFLIFSADYSFDTRHLVARDDHKEFTLLFRMVESHDRMLADSGGSWYLKRVDIDGTEHTYVRYFNHAAFGRRILGLRLALRNFGLRDIKSVMDAYYQEARTRIP